MTIRGISTFLLFSGALSCSSTSQSTAGAGGGAGQGGASLGDPAGDSGGGRGTAGGAVGIAASGGLGGMAKTGGQSGSTPTSTGGSAGGTGTGGAGDAGRERTEPTNVTNFNADWRFLEGDPSGAQDPSFNDSAWQGVSVPHDWINAKGLKDGSGTAWYRKHFSLMPADSGKKIFIDFDGIFHRSTVYLNGTRIGDCSYGFTPLVYDVTPQIKYSGENVVAVRVNTGTGDANTRDTRWYGGGGITRNVRLRITNAVYVDNRGTYITTPAVSTTSATVNVRTMVKNDRAAGQDVALRTTLSDVNGTSVVTLETPYTVAANASYEFTQDLTIKNPMLWDTTTPALYNARSEVVVGGAVVDTYDTRFGIRTVTWDANQGLLLNGKVIKIKGGCLHDDLGVLGTAFDEHGWERRLQTMKELGFNGVRTSHNARPREFLDLCDRLGILVYAEMFDSWTTAIYPNFDTDWQRDLSAAVTRDRNHPSVYIWSVGNETADQANPTAWAAKFNRMADWIHKNEPTRKVTTALSPTTYSPEDAKLEDVVSLNYGDNSKYESAVPGALIIDSENYPAWGDAWPGVLTTNYVVGMHIWSAIDYRGEGSNWGWNGAIIDLSGFPKAASSLYRAHWSDDGIMQIVVEDPGVPMPAANEASYWYWSNMGAHWTLPNLDGKQISVKTYTNCKDIELFINDVSQGTRHMTDNSNVVTWNVKYQAGTIKAVGKIGGTTKCSQTLTTAGAAAKIVLKPDRTTMKADGVDRVNVEVDVVDANGVLVPSANNQLTFDISGPGAVVATGNADMAGNILASAAFYGQALAVVQSTGTAGDVVLTVSSTGLTSDELTLPASASSAEVPYLFGLSRADADAKVAAAGLAAGTKVDEYSSVVPSGSVVRQNPVYGASVAAGTPVKLVISKGPR